MRTGNVFVSLEGVDGVGKTTVAKLIVAGGGFQYHKSPAGPFAALREEVDAHATPLERYCFYRLATQFDSAQVARLLKSGSVICDRYIASTAAYHIAMDPRVKTIHDTTAVLEPNFAFLLEARSDVRDQRLLKRGTTLSDVRLERDSAFLDHVAQAFVSLSLIRIDTSDMTIEEVALTIRNILAQGGRP